MKCYKQTSGCGVYENRSCDECPYSKPKEAECPTCHGTGKIGTTNWLTKHLTAGQLAKEKAEAIAEHERNIKLEVAREIFEEIESILDKRYQSNDTLSTSGRDEEYYAGRADLCLSLLGMIDEIKKKHLEKK